MAFGGDRGTSGRGFLAAGIALLLATPAAAGLIPGGGGLKSDCYVEFDVQGASGSNVVTCTDGDPTCDNDAQCDGTCTFRVALCPNQTDPNVPSCTPSSLTAQPVVNGATLNPVPDLAGSACSAAASVSVSTRKGGTKKGKKTIHVKATATSGKPKKDTDKLTLICLPRTGTCPPPTTTTVPTTTTTTASTTTTGTPPPTTTTTEAATTTTTASTTTTTAASTTTTTEATTTTTAASTTSTTESTTTTTTQAPVCGDNVVEPGETCDPPGSLVCPDPASPTGAFLACRSDCRCPGEPTTTTTTTEESTTTTTAESTTTTTAESTTTTTASTTTTTLPTLLRFTTVPGTTSCGGAAFSPAAALPLSGELDSDTGCSTKVADLGRGCLYFGGGKATIVPPGLIPDGATSTFSVTGPGTLGGNAGTGPKDCTNGSGPGKHCVNGHCNSDADCGNVAGACQAGVCNAGTQTSPLSCSTDANCGGSATSCRPEANCFFGPPLPIPSPPPNDALTTCVQNVVDTTATGTFDGATGDSNVTLPLGSRVYITGNSTDPCPRCISGTCDASWMDVNGSAGEDNGKACTTDGVVVQTSLQCRPPLGGYQANLPVNLSPLTTGTASMTNATGQFCPSQAIASAGAFGNATARCIQETGTPAGDLSDGNPHQSVIASVFCIPKTGNVAVDGVANLPGPGAIGINGMVQTQ